MVGLTRQTVAIDLTTGLRCLAAQGTEVMVVVDEGLGYLLSCAANQYSISEVEVLRIQHGPHIPAFALYDETHGYRISIHKVIEREQLQSNCQ